MTEQERQAALDALNEADECFQPETLEELRNHFKTIRAALSSPAVPVIEGLDEAIKANADLWGDYDGWRDNVICKAARAYASLQKGETK